MIGFINLVAPFYLIAYGVQSVQSNLAAILMSTTPLSSTVLGHFYTTNEKFNFIKTFGILIGFSGILYLFSDNLLIDENNFLSALLILLGSTCYVIGGVLTLKISKKKNENVTGSILIWATIILIPLVSFIEQPWNLTPRLDSTISVIYLGLVSTGIAWLLRFRILVNNGLIFQSQVSYLIPIFGTILSFIFLKELITTKVLISLIAVSVGIYFTRKADLKNILKAILAAINITNKEVIRARTLLEKIFKFKKFPISPPINTTKNKNQYEEISLRTFALVN